MRDYIAGVLLPLALTIIVMEKYALKNVEEAESLCARQQINEDPNKSSESIELPDHNLLWSTQTSQNAVTNLSEHINEKVCQIVSFFGPGFLYLFFQIKLMKFKLNDFKQVSPGL